METESLKEKGNLHFKAGRVALALKIYSRALENISDDVLPMNEEFKETMGLRLALQLNMAACRLKLNEPALAVADCDKVRRPKE